MSLVVSIIFFFFFFEFFFFFQAEDGIRDFCLSRGLGDVYKRQDFLYFYAMKKDEVIELLKERIKELRDDNNRLLDQIDDLIKEVSSLKEALLQKRRIS